MSQPSSYHPATDNEVSRHAVAVAVQKLKLPAPDVLPHLPRRPEAHHFITN